MFNIQSAIEKLVNKKDLKPEEIQAVMWAILSDSVTPMQLGGFLVGLRAKGETVLELVTALEVLRELVSPIAISNQSLIDIVGTGGDQAQTFNISTCSAFVVAAAGGKVAKHGSRSVSSRSGSADVLEAAGIVLTLTPAQIEVCINKIGVGLIYAPENHTAIKNAFKPQKELGIRSIFNLIRPLVNPANVKRQLIGVFDKRWLTPIAEVLQQIGSQHVMVVNAEDGLDEISINSVTHITELKDNKITSYVIAPEDFGFIRMPLDTIRVNSAEQSLALIQSVLQNHAGPARDIVALNAGAAIYIAGLTQNLQTGINKALSVLENGEAYNRFLALQELSQQLSLE